MFGDESDDDVKGPNGEYTYKPKKTEACHSEADSDDDDDDDDGDGDDDNGNDAVSDEDCDDIPAEKKNVLNGKRVRNVNGKCAQPRQNRTRC